MIEVHVKDYRVPNPFLVHGKVTKVENDHLAEDIHLLSLSLQTGYRVVLYLSRQEMVKLLETFPEEQGKI